MATTPTLPRLEEIVPEDDLQGRSMVT